MHDQLAVRVGDRFGHLREQLQPRVHRRAAVRGSTRRCGGLRRIRWRDRAGRRRVSAGVVQVRDVRMGERGEDLAFARHALREPGALPRAVRQLQRNRPIDEPVGALRQPDHAHAAAAQLAHQPIRHRSHRPAVRPRAEAGARSPGARSNFGRVFRKSPVSTSSARASRVAQARLEPVELGAPEFRSTAHARLRAGPGPRPAGD